MTFIFFKYASVQRLLRSIKITVITYTLLVYKN
jgi:hypothetical protein